MAKAKAKPQPSAGAPKEGGSSFDFADRGEATYKVTLPTFEGPLDLLLHLVQKHELSIVDLPVSFVTAKYLEYLSLMRIMQIDVASEYLVMAATLAHLKSRELLPPDPTQDVELGEDGEELDPREALIRRLLQYQKYKDAAAKLGERPIAGRDVFPRPATAMAAEASSDTAPLAEIGIFKLLEAFQGVLSKAKIEHQHEVTADRITITERIHELCDLLRFHPKTTFEELFTGLVTRFDYVITFLAILEMAKMRMTRLYQSEPYAPLYLELAVTDEDALAEAKSRLPQQ